MSDEQPTSWRDRFFGSGPAPERATEPTGQDAGAGHVANPAGHDDAPAEDTSTQPLRAADGGAHDAEIASTSVDEHDDHQPLVEHQGDARAADSPIEPTVIAPSTLRGPSHSAAHPDDTARVQPQGDAATSSLERPEIAQVHHADEPSADVTHAEDAPTEAIATDPVATEPPALVEPRRPSFGLRRQSGHDADAGLGATEHGATDHDVTDRGVTDRGTTDRGTTDPAAVASLAGLAAAGGAAAGGATAARPREEREFVEPEPTQAIDQQPRDERLGDRSDDATRPIGTRGTDGDAAGDTRVLEAQEPATETRPQRFGIVRDDTPAALGADDSTVAAPAAAGTPVVLVEEPVPPRRKGARAVGFAVALLATLIFAILFAAAFFAVGYLFDRAFDATETLQTLWLLPSYLLPVIVFFLGYWLLTLIVNRAGWWAHVLGGFIVALLVYVAHLAGAYMETQGGWAGYTALPGIDARALSELLLAPLSVLAFVLAREVPIWVGGIVARRGRKAREHNRQAMDDFNAENADRLSR
ncbi:hypothetical protein ACVWW9_001403 [Agrococcus sp. UYP33]